MKLFDEVVLAPVPGAIVAVVFLTLRLLDVLLLVWPITIPVVREDELFAEEILF